MGAPPAVNISDLVWERRVSILCDYDQRETGYGSENVGQTYLIDDEGYLALGKDMYNSGEYGLVLGEPDDDIPLISSWHQYRTPDGRKLLKNHHTGNFLNVKGITRGTDNTTLLTAQPRLSAFEDDPGFYWEFIHVEGNLFNIVLYGTEMDENDADDPRTGALSNRGFPLRDYVPIGETVFDELALGYNVSQTGNFFLSEPCFKDYATKHMQWRFDANLGGKTWAETLNTDNAFWFEFFVEE